MIHPRSLPLLASLLLATTCGHSPPAPPAGMARLIVKCCQLTLGDDGAASDCRPNRTLDSAAVWIDGDERGTCANWHRDGAILSTGRHVIQVKVPLDGPLEEGECCVDAGSYVTLHGGEILTQQVGLKALPSQN